jgi:hypothetical protein
MTVARSCMLLLQLCCRQCTRQLLMNAMLTNSRCYACVCTTNYLQSALNRHHKIVQVALAVVEALQRTAKQSAAASSSRDSGWEDCATSEKLQLSALQVCALSYSNYPLFALAPAYVAHCIVQASKQAVLQCDSPYSVCIILY